MAEETAQSIESVFNNKGDSKSHLDTADKFVEDGFFAKAESNEIKPPKEENVINNEGLEIEAGFTLIAKESSNNVNNTPKCEPDKMTPIWKTKIIEKIPAEELERLSKNQRKKLFKQKIFDETRYERRQQERSRHKEKRKHQIELGLAVPQQLKAKHYKDVEYHNPNIVVDLDFYDFMNERDLNSVVKQINRCYSINRKAQHPVHLHVTSYSGAWKDLFLRLQPGSLHWNISFQEKNFIDVFPENKIVYLSSDSENVLEALEEDTVYVIGGLVDHNQHKGICLERAKEKGIAHAQLPIDKFISLLTRKILTINHVFGVLSKHLETGDWKESFFSVLPKRKGVEDKKELET